MQSGFESENEGGTLFQISVYSTSQTRSLQNGEFLIQHSHKEPLEECGTIIIFFTAHHLHSWTPTHTPRRNSSPDYDSPCQVRATFVMKVLTRSIETNCMK